MMLIMRITHEGAKSQELHSSKVEKPWEVLGTGARYQQLGWDMGCYFGTVKIESKCNYGHIHAAIGAIDLPYPTKLCAIPKSPNLPRSRQGTLAVLGALPLPQSWLASLSTQSTLEARVYHSCRI